MTRCWPGSVFFIPNPIAKARAVLVVGFIFVLKLQLSSDELGRAIRSLLNSRQYQCSYQVRRGATLIAEVDEVEIIREKHGLFIYTKPVPSDALIVVSVRCNNQVWTCPGIAVDAHEVQMEKD